MYLPALPTIRQQLGTTSATVQLTLTGTLVGLALGQLVIGPLSDTLGRRRPLLAGTALHVVASLLVLVAPNIAVLGVLRVLQGVGTAATAVVALAIVRDLFDGRAAATMLSRLFLVMGVAPVLAPTIGGEILRFTSWRGVFAVLAVYGVVVLILGSVALRETLPAERRHPAASPTRCGPTALLLRDRRYVGLIVVAGLTMAALFTYVSGSSFVYQQQFGLDEQQFGLLFGAGAVWLISATQLNPVLLRWWSPAQILVTATVAGTTAGGVLLALAATGTGGLFGVAVPLWAVLFASGLALPERPRARAGRVRRVGRLGRRPARRRPVRRRRGGVAAGRAAGQRRARHGLGHRRARCCSPSSCSWSSCRPWQAAGDPGRRAGARPRARRTAARPPRGRPARPSPRPTAGARTVRRRRAGAAGSRRRPS